MDDEPKTAGHRCAREGVLIEALGTPEACAGDTNEIPSGMELRASAPELFCIPGPGDDRMLRLDAPPPRGVSYT